MVVAAAAGFPRVIDFHRLFNLGSVPGYHLLFWQLHFAIVFAGNFWGLTAQLAWTETWLVANVAHLFAGPACSLGAGWISADVLLLPRRILQSILG